MFGKSIVCNEIESAEREFLAANGQGGFAAMSLNGGPSRKYHALSIAALKPPLDRYVTLHNLEETLDGVSLAAYRQAGETTETVADGFKYLSAFRASPFPTYTYAVNGNLLEKEVVAIHGHNAVLVTYRLPVAVQGEVALQLDILLNNRDCHQVGTLTSAAQIKTLEQGPGQVTFDLGPVVGRAQLAFDKGHYSEVNRLRENLVYYLDQVHRGEEGLDTAVHQGSLTLGLAEGEEVHVLFSLGALEGAPRELRQRELRRQEALRQGCGSEDAFFQDLALAADQFVVSRESTGGKTVLAGYPWFSDWGRDTMIALTGLTLATNRAADAASILKTFAHYCSQGMLPNKFPDYDGEPLMYNTIDASLWYFHAIQNYVDYTRDHAFVQAELWPSMKSIIRHHLAGTRYGIRVDPADGLLAGGDESTQLTWMDVKYKGWAVTPRYGKAVEINALWYNALRIMENLAPRFGEPADEYRRHAQRVLAHFEPTFWNPELGCLYDYVTEDTKVADIRPNQIFAVSLPHSLLAPDKEKAVVDLVAAKLYTPCGLRSLAAEDPKFIGIYQGTLKERDACYHQGTVWSWPLGHFLSAHKKVYGDPAKLNRYLAGIKSHFYQEACINNISEIFDGLEPNKARGCYAQAWSVGEILRVLREELE